MNLQTVESCYVMGIELGSSRKQQVFLSTKLLLHPIKTLFYGQNSEPFHMSVISQDCSCGDGRLMLTPPALSPYRFSLPVTCGCGPLPCDLRQRRERAKGSRQTHIHAWV